MPASVLNDRVSLSIERPCPACAELSCSDPAECLYFLTVNPWGECEECAGSGFASDAESCLVGMIHCRYCNGSCLVEHAPGTLSPEEVTTAAAALHAAHVERLRTGLGQVPGERVLWRSGPGGATRPVTASACTADAWGVEA